MLGQADNLLYSNAVKWINENPQDKRIPEPVKQEFLCFTALPPDKKTQLLITLDTLLKTTGLPLAIEASLPWLRFDAEGLPVELLFKIGSHRSNLLSTSGRMYSLFSPTRLLDKFLQLVAYGEQDKAERLFTDVYQGNVEKIQVALRSQSRVTDYSGRTFHCTAYEYAYWAKDTHMCRMLERYMDEATKAEMLKRINEIERIDEATGKPTGLKYQQNGAEHRSAHFDLTPLITALQEYVNGGYEGWFNANSLAAAMDAWMKVGMAQRDVPAHVAQEYCRPDRPFFPLPSFNVDREDIPRETLPRVLAFNNWNNRHVFYLWFPLGQADSGLGRDFAVIRGAWTQGAQAGLRGGERGAHVHPDLAAIRLLDKVRTEDLRLSRAHLIPPAYKTTLLEKCLIFAGAFLGGPERDSLPDNTLVRGRL